jgi:hypothetical protein
VKTTVTLVAEKPKEVPKVEAPKPIVVEAPKPVPKVEVPPPVPKVDPVVQRQVQMPPPVEAPKVLPEIVMRSSKHHRQLSTRRPPWDDRFFVDGVTNYTEAHPYFKVLTHYNNLYRATLTSQIG